MTWVYLPTSCRSAQESADLTSASESLCRTLESSVMWKGKRTRWQSWRQRWKRVSWTKRLFGMISGHSTADRGVERWIGSLAGSRASHTAPLESEEEETTNGTFGLQPPESLEKSDHRSSSWRMFQESFGIITNELGQSFEEWATGLRKDYSQRKRLALHMDANGSSSWLTPTTRSEAPNKGSNAVNVPKTIMEASKPLWQTPKVSPGDYTYTHGNHADPWPSLSGQAKQFPTPSVSDVKGWDGSNKSRPSKHFLSYFPLGLKDSMSGHSCSEKCRRLNPLFVGWLMGFPMGWGLLPLEHINLLDMETLLCLWLERTRLALSWLEQRGA